MGKRIVRPWCIGFGGSASFSRVFLNFRHWNWVEQLETKTKMTELVATLSPDRMIGALDEELHRLKAICSEIEHDLMSSPIRLRFSGQSATRKASRPSSIMVTITEVDDDQGIHERNDPTNNETSEMLVSTDLPIQEQSIQEQTIQEPDDDDDDDDVYDGLFTIRLFDDDDDEVQMPQPQMIPALEVTID